jgi:hypothetical protein
MVDSQHCCHGFAPGESFRNLARPNTMSSWKSVLAKNPLDCIGKARTS